MTRFVPVTVLMMMLAASRIAGAQGTTLPNGITVTFDKLYIHEDGSKEAIQPRVEPDSEWKYFNYAHCQCGKAMPDFVEANFEYLVLASSAAPPVAEPLEIWVGASCSTNSDGTDTRAANCTHTASDTTVDAIQASTNTRVEIPIFQAMTPEVANQGMDCQQRVLSATVWGLGNSMIGVSNRDYSTSKSITTDSEAPPLPSNFQASGGDSAIQISWTASTVTSDILGFQALCAHAEDDSPGNPGGKPSPRYMTTKTLCDIDQAVLPDNGVPISVPAGSPDVGSVVTLTDDMKNLNPDFLCGESISATTTSLRIEGLENGRPYKIALLVVDKYQNVRGTFFASTVTPIPSTDFWEDLHNRGSHAEGGLCLLAETYGDDSSLTGALRAFRDDTLGGSRLGRWLTHAYYASLGELGGYVHGSLALRVAAGIVLAPLVAIGLLWHLLGLAGLLALLAMVWLVYRRRAWLRRLAWLGARWRRQLPRLAPVIAAMAVALGAGPAHAGGNQPYWEDADQNADNASENDGQVTWHVGFRIGPYTPGIDAQVGGPSPGPFEQMFGARQHLLTMLDVDRVLWSGFGQLGVGLSLGYWQKTARAFAMDSSPTDGSRARAADRNAFRLIPTALSAIYRFTWLDDEYGVPVVPYARAGLAYYIWWITVANGDFARVCGADGTNCGGKAYGASLGVQGAIGLSLRAERIDASAAMSMRQSGIEHAGIYGELSAAKVDGFGSDKKLSVGDTTWFAGVEFEF